MNIQQWSDCLQKLGADDGQKWLCWASNVFDNSPAKKRTPSDRPLVLYIDYNRLTSKV